MSACVGVCAFRECDPVWECVSEWRLLSAPSLQLSCHWDWNVRVAAHCNQGIYPLVWIYVCNCVACILHPFESICLQGCYQTCLLIQSHPLLLAPSHSPCQENKHREFINDTNVALVVICLVLCTVFFHVFMNVVVLCFLMGKCAWVRVTLLLQVWMCMHLRQWIWAFTFFSNSFAFASLVSTLTWSTMLSVEKQDRGKEGREREKKDSG